MQEWHQKQQLFMIIAIICLIMFSIIFLYNVITKEAKKNKKYLDVLYPKNETKEEEFIINKKGQKKRKKKSKFKTKLNNFIQKKGYVEKINALYYRAGKTKTIKDFIFDGIKYLVLGVGLFFIFYYLVANVLIAGFIGILIITLPYINLYSKIKEREKKFRNEFPYFLQTVAFVLKNGTNFSSAFFEVTKKQEEGVLKEVMLEVIEIQNINAGNYESAFRHIPEKIKIEEASEFVNVVLDNMSKGVSVADTFMQQAQNTTKILDLNKKKKISSASTKILLPILIMCMAIIVMFLQMFG